MNFMEKLFGKEKRSQQQNGSTVAGKSAGSKNEIGSPMEGKLIELKDVPDEAFAQGILGDGVAIRPTKGEVYAPADGTVDTLFDTLQAGELKAFNVVIKADVQGSVEAVKQSLLKIENDEVRVHVIHGAVGSVSESDVMLAAASNAIIVAFNTGVDPVAKENADRDGVEIRSYNIIYDAIEEIDAAMRGMRAPKYRDVDTGTAEVREVYKISSAGTIAGSLVTSGNIRREGKVRLVRDGKQLADVPLKGLKRFKDDVKDVSSGYECGISLEGWDDIQPGDVLECYVVEEYRD